MIGNVIPEEIRDRESWRSSRLLRWCKFNLVGGIGMAVQFSVLFAMKSILRVDYMIATAIAVEVAVVHNFIWHERFTWADRAKAERRARMELDVKWPRMHLRRFVRFNLTTGVVSIAGNLLLMRILVGQAGMNYLLANAIAIAVCSIANFAVSDEWVFERPV